MLIVSYVQGALRKEQQAGLFVEQLILNVLNLNHALKQYANERQIALDDQNHWCPGENIDCKLGF